MDVVVANPGPPQQQQQQQLQTSPQALLVIDPSLEEQDLKTPKKRAETWVQDEIKALIALRKEMDQLFNTSKSNKHLWEQISAKMKERGYERSATMCTDKWRNLLKEYKKAKHLDRGGSAKVACYKDLEELLGDRVKSQTPSKAVAPAVNKIETPSSLLTPASKAMGEGEGESFLQMLGEDGFDGSSLQDGGPGLMRPQDGGILLPIVTTRSALNLERRLDHDGHPTAIPSTDGMVQSGLMPANGITPPQAQWNWRDSNSNGGERRPVSAPAGKVIMVKYGETARRIRIDGPFESIKESVKTAFGLRSKRGFWLEDDEGVVQTLSRDMPIGEYTLNLDPGITVKICPYEGEQAIQAMHAGKTESKTLYSEEDFRDFLTRRGWEGLREVGGFRDVDSLDELRTGAVYQRAAGMVVA